MIQDEILHLLGDRPHVSDEQEVTLSEYSAVRIDVFIDLASSYTEFMSRPSLQISWFTSPQLRVNAHIRYTFGE